MTIEVSAKKVEDAIEKGLKELGVKLEDANVEVIDAGGILRKAKVRLTVEDGEEHNTVSATNTDDNNAVDSANDSNEPAKTENNKTAVKPAKPEKAEKAKKTEKSVKSENTDNAEKAEKAVKAKPSKAEKSVKREQNANVDIKEQASDLTTDGTTEKRTHTKHEYTPEEIVAIDGVCEFVKKTVELMGFEGITVTHDTENSEVIEIHAKEGDDSLIIGRHGETLSALTYIAETCAVAENHRVGVVVDCNGYRSRRASSLSAMARRRARECASKQIKIKLETMDRTDRRTVHMALADDKFVDTISEGKEPFRYVVIVPKKNVRPSGRKSDRNDRNDRNAKRRNESSSVPTAPQKRVQFDINLHGFVGHNDNADVENSSTEQKAD